MLVLFLAGMSDISEAKGSSSKGSKDSKNSLEKLDYNGSTSGIGKEVGGVQSMNKKMKNAVGAIGVFIGVIFLDFILKKMNIFQGEFSFLGILAGATGAAIGYLLSKNSSSRKKR